jgi:hypothetical protein
MTDDPLVAALSGLKDFQMRTVNHAERALFERGQRKFLVADEVGLGKTLVARGVVARTIERLRAQNPPVTRIDIVYICSNQEIARQNLQRLNVLGREDLALPSRITLLPLHTRQLRKHNVNFVSFTPGTSFDPRSRTGWARERALLYRLLREPWGLGEGRGTRELLRVEANWPRIRQFARDMDDIDTAISRRFVSAASKATLHRDLERLGETDWRRERGLSTRVPLRDEFERLRAIAARRDLSDDDRRDRNILISALRWRLAEVCVHALRPNLVILDEFQNFSTLLGGNSEAAELANQLFDFSRRGERARVLLLSATPFPAFSQAGAAGPTHHKEVERLLRFLFEDVDAAENVEQLLASFRDELFRIESVDVDGLKRIRTELQAALSSVMVRTERLASSATRHGMLETRPSPAFDLRSTDVATWLELSHLHTLLHERELLESTAAVAELWKTTPWLAQFMDYYKFKEAITEGLAHIESDPELRSALHRVRRQLPWERFHSYQPLNPPNPRMRSLLADTADRAWDLLWVPASMPYHHPGRPFSSDRAERLTKRLIFSAWTVAPRAIAALISYEAERRVFKTHDAGARNNTKARRGNDRRLLDFKIAREAGSDRTASMPHLSWMYPSTVLSAELDPLVARRQAGRELPKLSDVVGWAQARAQNLLATVDVPTDEARVGVDQRWYWAAPLLLDRAHGSDAARAFWDREWLSWDWSQRGDEQLGDYRGAANWRRHVEEARKVFITGMPLGRRPRDLARVIATIGLAGPGTVALRSFCRTVPDADGESRLVYAAQLGWAMRRLFNTPEAIAIIDAQAPETPYWRASIDYALRGNLQAVFDEWAHLVAEDAGAGRDHDDRTLALMTERMCMALGVGAGRVEVDRLDGHANEAWRSHFGVRYGQASDGGPRDSHHPEALRRAFNSPFHPFVLATTSVGQEGLDFHTYCHAVVHWNLPSNPVDLEQREGRVHRYKNHAVRRNVAEHHSNAVVASKERDPWTAAFAAAVAARRANDDDLVPYWLQPGSTVIERYVPALPLSRDEERFERVKQQVTLYRMVFGQPRQDDLLAYLQATLGQDAAERLATLLKVDLSPPKDALRRPRRRARAARAGSR